MKSFLLPLAALLLFTTLHAQDSTKTKKKLKPWESFDKIRNSRYITTDEIGVLMGFQGNAKNAILFSYQTVNGWQFERHVYGGFGTGVEIGGQKSVLVNENSSKTALMVPLFWETRASLLSKRVSPYLSMKLGYNFYLALPGPDKKVIGGAFYQAALGFKAFITQQSAFNFSIGYRMQAIAVPAKYGAQFADYPPQMPGEFSSQKTAEYYHFLVALVGFTY